MSTDKERFDDCLAMYLKSFEAHRLTVLTDDKHEAFMAFETLIATRKASPKELWDGFERVRKSAKVAVIMAGGAV